MKLRNKKTGKIIECKNIVFTHCNAFALDWEQYTPNVNSLTELNEEWEDYKPAEPLIRDKNIRDAIRAWAKSNLVERVKFEYVKGTGSVFAYSDFGAKIIFYGDLRLTNRTTYEIDDLCGEEE